MTSRAIPTTFDDVIERLRACGYDVRIDGGMRHYGVFAPDGARVYSLPLSSGDHRGARNAVAEIRRLGIADLSIPPSELRRIKRRRKAKIRQEARTDEEQIENREVTMGDQVHPIPSSPSPPKPAETARHPVTPMDLLVDMADALGRDPDDFLLTLLESYASQRRARSRYRAKDKVTRMTQEPQESQ